MLSCIWWAYFYLILKPSSTQSGSSFVPRIKLCFHMFYGLIEVPTDSLLLPPSYVVASASLFKRYLNSAPARTAVTQLKIVSLQIVLFCGGNCEPFVWWAGIHILITHWNATTIAFYAMYDAKWVGSCAIIKHKYHMKINGLKQLKSNGRKNRNVITITNQIQLANQHSVDVIQHYQHKTHTHTKRRCLSFVFKQLPGEIV